MFGSSGLLYVCMVALVTSSGTRAEPAPSFETIDNLFDVEDRVKVHSIKDPVPVYRKDLEDDYVAYWQFTVNGDEQLIVSAGPHTGDYKLVFQGKLPTMTSILDHIAWEGGQQCNRYYMLSPDVTLMCEDGNGRVIATTRDSYIKHQPKHSNDTSLRYRYIEKNCHKVKQDWTERAKEVGEDGVWDEMSFIPKEAIHQTDEDDLEADGLFILHRGQTVKIPFTGKERVKLFSPDHSEHRLCELFNICTADKRGNVDTTIAQKNSYNISYIPLTVPESMHGKDVRFSVRVYTSLGLVIKRFYIDLNTRSKRQTYTPWVEVSIGHESIFPDYRQFKIESGCAVGCGPVAWAMIFAYFDRRSHLQAAVYGSGSQNLFRCGADGTAGAASCVAPISNNNQVEEYLKVLRGILRTFCIRGEGATLQRRMDDVEGFFKARQSSGSPDVISHRVPLIGFFGVYNSRVRSKGLAALRAGWPIIPGIRVGGLFSQHYPVATKYRSRVKTQRRCFFWKCWNKRTTEYEMYLHMGWGGNQNGWRSAKMFFVTYAKY
ncbi:uncharacterized protein LOC135469032 [Liolophura sinensis]|uniref:uncharacterized protein LOC135469032 n=1 Tax=Liolophura sinensis TaxID=3198878 RepID=UPI0031590624